MTHGPGAGAVGVAEAVSRAVEGAMSAFQVAGGRAQLVASAASFITFTCHAVCTRVSVSGPLSAISRSDGSSNTVTSRCHTSRYTRLIVPGVGDSVGNVGLS